MQLTKGYIYIRTHSTYDIYNVCRLGTTSNIFEQNKQSTKDEIEKGGYFNVVFEVPIENMVSIECSLKKMLTELNVLDFNRSTSDFYKKTSIQRIEPYLNALGIQYKKLNEQEIKTLLKMNIHQKQNNFKNIKIKKRRTFFQIV